MPDDLRERIESLRRLRDAASPLPWGGEIVGAFDTAHHSPVYVHAADGTVPVYCYGGGKIQRLEYVVAAANLAPALADAYDAAVKAIAERDAEIARLRTVLAEVQLSVDELKDKYLSEFVSKISAAALKGKPR